MVGNRNLYNTTGTHSRDEGRSNTPTCQCVSKAQPLFQCTFKKKATFAKRKQIPSLTFGPTHRLAPAPTP